MKKMIILRSDHDWNPDFDLLRSNISVPGKLGMSWSLMRDESPVISCYGNALIQIDHQRKLLPASLISKELKIRLKKIEADQGYKAGKKQRKDIEMAITEEFFVKAFVVSKYINIWINKENRLVCIDSTSRDEAEEVLSVLCRDLLFRGHFLTTETSPSVFMSNLLRGDPLNGFWAGTSCVLQGMVDGKKKISYSNEELTQARINVEDGVKKPTKMEICHIGGSFVMGHDLALSKIDFPHSKEDKLENQSDADRFDHEFVVRSLECVSLIKSLLEVMVESYEDDSYDDQGNDDE